MSACFTVKPDGKLETGDPIFYAQPCPATFNGRSVVAMRTASEDAADHALRLDYQQVKGTVQTLEGTIDGLTAAVAALGGSSSSPGGTVATPEELGINAADVALVWSWGLGSVLVVWALGIILQAALTAIRKA
jgi:hypothetical protein